MSGTLERRVGRDELSVRPLAWLSRLGLAGLCLAGVSGCAMKPAEFAGTRPELNIQKYYTGHTRSEGFIESRSAAPLKPVTTETWGRMAGGELELTQDVTIGDGKPTRRIWKIRQVDATRFRMRTEFALKLSSQESRLEFFRVLKEADGDGGKETQAFIDQFTKRISFAQLAQIADSVSGPPKVLAPDEPTRERPKNVRFRVALNSRDATPIDRWNWLTQRTADRPSGNALHDLIHGWCEDNYPATADFVHSMPAGRERQAMTDTVARFLIENGAEKLAKEWTER